MTLLEAIEARHSVRKFKDEPIPGDILTILRDRGRGGFKGESLAGFGGAMARAAAGSRCVGPARVSQPLFLYWAGGSVATGWGLTSRRLTA